MEDEIWLTFLPIILPIIGGLVVAIKKWFNVSEKIKHIRNLIDAVDDALRDDKITEGEFRIIFGKYKTLVRS